MVNPLWGPRWGRLLMALAWLSAGAGADGSLWAREAPAAAQGALEDATPSTPRLPDASAPEAVADDAPMSPREAAMEARIRQLEIMVEQLSGQIRTAAPGVGAVGGARPGAGAAPAAGAIEFQGEPGAPGAAGSAPGDAPLDVGVPATTAEPSATGGVGAPGQSLPPNPPPNARFDMPATLESKRSNVKFGPGFEIRTDDDEFILQFHNLTQIEYRGYEEASHATERDSFLIPRQWWMFSGRVTKPIGYFVSFANGFDAMSMLDVFLDFDFDPKFRVRFGRFKAPFTYEFLIEPPQGMVLPERSVFFNNFGQNRDLGVMGFGRLFRNTVDYAAGIFNGNRNGYVATTDSKFVSAYINWKPFNNVGGSLFENLNVGGSVYGGANDSAPMPQVMRTVVPMAGNSVAGVPFLAFNNNVREIGPMTFWDLHTAYYYKQLAINAEWASGFQDYALNSALAYKTHLPVQSFYVQAGYLLTGETRSGLGVVKPRRPLGRKDGVLGFGAWELTGRYQQMDLGKQVFANGLADSNLWTNSLYTTDLGFNWHMNQYLKFLFTWEHAEFGQPVFSNVGPRSKTSDLFLARMQLYF